MKKYVSLIPFLLAFGCGDEESEYVDADLDGFFDCDQILPADRELIDCDCNDEVADVNPGAAEICDGRDTDCDNKINNVVREGVMTVWYRDADEDGFGSYSKTRESCIRPNGYVGNHMDCNDGDDSVYPGAPERCNNFDDNCNLEIDEGLDVDAEWYYDADGDGIGAGEIVETGCTDNFNLSRRNDDCDDFLVNVNPEAPELCDGYDNNCDSLIDDFDPNLVGGRLYYLDDDSDTFGTPLFGTWACVPPSGFVLTNDDCNDADPFQHPSTVWYRDADMDGRGDENGPMWNNGVEQCLQPIGYAYNNFDCDDSNPLEYKGIEWYGDADGDGFGDSSHVVWVGCGGDSANHTSIGGDCDDRNAAVNPNGVEICDGLDNNCNGATDYADPLLAAGEAKTFYYDNDGDGEGGWLAFPVEECFAPNSRYVENDIDCDDENFYVTSETYWYADADRDGFGAEDATPVGPTCAAPPGHSPNKNDCDDTNFYKNEDTQWWLDGDGDQIGAGPVFANGCEEPDASGELNGHPATYIFGDCNDRDPLQRDAECGVENYTNMVFSLTLDADPTNVGAEIICDGQSIYSVPSYDAALAYQTVTFETEQLDGLVCQWNVVDNGGDGGPSGHISFCGVPDNFFTIIGSGGNVAVFATEGCVSCDDPAASNYDPNAIWPAPAMCLY